MSRLRSLAALVPGRRDYRDLPRSWRGDLLAGVRVAVVALPLALAFGVTSGLGAEAGIVTAIVAGVVAGVFGGSHVQVSGPTGAMTVVLVPVVASVGPGGVVVVALAAGLLLVVAGALRLGRYAGILPWPVVEGFTVGIALLIFLQQVPAALGVDKPDGENTAVVAVKAIGEWAADGWAALALVALVVATMALAPRLHRALPASLIAVAVATAVAELSGLHVARIGHIPSSLPAPSLPDISAGELPGLLSAIVAVAALAAIESLLFEYWPGAETAQDGSENSRSMARKMNAYKKYVFTGASEKSALEWSNAEEVPAHGDEDIVAFVDELKAQPGGDIHLSGGARLAQTIVRLGLVDQYHFVVHPVVSPGSRWFDEIDGKHDLTLLSATAYSNGVVGLYYEPHGDGPPR